MALLALDAGIAFFVKILQKIFSQKCHFIMFLGQPNPNLASVFWFEASVLRYVNLPRKCQLFQNRFFLVKSVFWVLNTNITPNLHILHHIKIKLACTKTGKITILEILLKNFYKKITNRQKLIMNLTAIFLLQNFQSWFLMRPW